MKVATFLAAHPKVSAVHYPGLPDNAFHALAKRQMADFGGMLSFEARGGREAAMAVAARVELFTRATSLGGVESLIEHPAIMTHASIPPHVREELGISDAFVRLSVGVENVADLIADLEQALA
jgi:cystathionine beta-lyase/cystathionine gamma-synthase